MFTGRYLIVIDDLWRTSDWEIIRVAFPHNDCNSRIIITTRVWSIACSCWPTLDGLGDKVKRESPFNKEEEEEEREERRIGRQIEEDEEEEEEREERIIGRQTEDLFVHEVKPLGELDSKRLFSDAAFGSGGTCLSDNSCSLVFDEILRICNGIPLFIIAMANMMRQEQEEVADKVAAGWLERIPELKQVEEALSPSYYDLPQELKLLSLYMSSFARGHKIEKHDLFMKWEAEGLIAPDTGREIQDLAEEHFTGLVERYIICPMTCRENDFEVDRWYYVNDFMLEFLSSVSAQENSLATSRTIKSATAAAAAAGDGDKKAWKLERLFFHQPNAKLPVLLERSDVSHTRSLTVSGLVNKIPLDKFVHLVVLSLEGWQNLEDDDLEQICSSNFRLKYVSVRNTPISKLPPQITELGYLETLDISHTQISKLPSQLWELGELRVLDLRGTQITMLPGPMRHRAVHLKHVLINCDETDSAVTEVPEAIVYCPRLEWLETVDLSNCSATLVKKLALQESLKVLGVKWPFHKCYDERYQKALRLAIQKSKNLESLTIHCELGCSMEFLDTLPNAPPQSLKNIRIYGRFLTVPKWIPGLDNLSFLQITVCKLAPEDIKLLGTLHGLECLVLGLDFLPEEAIVIGCDGFINLQKLAIGCRIPWLVFQTGSMPKLTGLDLRMLSADPAGQDSEPSGIANLLNLEQITIHYYPGYTNCRKVTAVVDAVRRQVAELGYTVRIMINDVEDDAKRSCGDMQLTATS
ncbi:hypothetical protein SEVIR_8G192700v4 [Setaria viridis]